MTRKWWWWCCNSERGAGVLVSGVSTILNSWSCSSSFLRMRATPPPLHWQKQTPHKMADKGSDCATATATTAALRTTKFQSFVSQFWWVHLVHSCTAYLFTFYHFRFSISCRGECLDNGDWANNNLAPSVSKTTVPYPRDMAEEKWTGIKGALKSNVYKELIIFCAPTNQRIQFWMWKSQN